jgi:hypothetical protein
MIEKTCFGDRRAAYVATGDTSTERVLIFTKYRHIVESCRSERHELHNVSINFNLRNIKPRSSAAQTGFGCGWRGTGAFAGPQ